MMDDTHTYPYKEMESHPDRVGIKLPQPYLTCSLTFPGIGLSRWVPTVFSLCWVLEPAGRPVAPMGNLFISLSN